ncbi:hypothetical protein JTE90_014236, partial [Oedothorax gibbosus]
EYSVSEQRKKDQLEVDKQILAVVKQHPEKTPCSTTLGPCSSSRIKCTHIR